jgi:CheY-like chemotaxis protein
MSYQIPTDGNPLAVLVVEDNEADVVWLQRILEQARFKHTMFVAKNGEIAIEFLSKAEGYESAFDPDLILLDINLPKVSGLEVLDAVQSDRRLKDTPLCVLIGSQAERDFLARRYKLDVRCHLMKPITAHAFGDALGTHERLKYHHDAWHKSA